MPRLLPAVAAVAMLAAVSAADAEWTSSGNVGFTSEYVFRGISQSGEDPALQGGFDFNHDSGAYIGVWGSSVEFPGDAGGASIETDFYGGYANKMDGGLGYDVGAIYYGYPGADSDRDFSFFEVYGKLSYDLQPVTLTGGVFYSPEYFEDTGSALYYFAGAELPFAKTAAVTAQYGRQEIDDADSYDEWKVGVTGEIAGFVAEVAYHDTDLDSDLSDERIVAGISRQF